MRIFLAGALGVIGRRLLPFTDLPDSVGLAIPPAALERNARIRVEGTRNLVAAARSAGVARVIAQSIAFVYATGPEPHAETDALASDGPGEPGAVTLQAVRVLEGVVTTTAGLSGAVLRYGRLYGPGTWSGATPARTALHVGAAAHAALLALERDAAGIFNIAEETAPCRSTKRYASLASIRHSAGVLMGNDRDLGEDAPAAVRQHPVLRCKKSTVTTIRLTHIRHVDRHRSSKQPVYHDSAVASSQHINNKCNRSRA